MKTTTLILTGLCLALWVASGQNSFANRKAINCVRAQYSAERGYTLDATYMTASMMDRKVVDIQRAAYWKKQGHTFDPTCMTASMMDRAVRTGGVSSQPSTTRVPPAIAQNAPCSVFRNSGSCLSFAVPSQAPNNSPPPRRRLFVRVEI